MILLSTIVPILILHLPQEQYPQLKDAADDMISQTPMGRMGEPKEISALVAFLCLPAASYLTGQIITANGGLTA